MVLPETIAVELIHLIESEPEFRLDPRWQLVERILLTGPFQKSTHLPALLCYLAVHSIQGQSDALTERQIGVAIFGKSVGYSPVEDSAVRVHVRQLRLRLHEYFACEGRRETLLVDIPKGAYVLGFHSADTEPGPLPDSPSVTPMEGEETRRIAVQKVLFWIALIAALVCAVGWYRATTTGARANVPWPLNAVIQENRETRVVVSDGSSMLRLLGQRETSLEQYLQPGFRESMIPPHMDENVSRLVNYISDSQLTSFADLAVSATLVKLAGERGGHLALISARDLNRRDLEHGNYMFLGSQISNPWVSLFADNLNFEVVEDGVGGKMYFRNKKPLPGEQNTYEGLAYTGSSGEEYATISLLPTSSGNGNILIFQGLRQEGTEALSVLLDDARNRTELKRVLGIPVNSQEIVYFEALIRARAVAGAPVSISIVATRIIRP